MDMCDRTEIRERGTCFAKGCSVKQTAEKKTRIIVSERPIRPVFKRCGMCGAEWLTREAFLHDEDVHLVGFQKISERVHTAKKVAGLLVYNHARAQCGTTLCIPAQRLWISTLSKAEREPLEAVTKESYS